MIKRYIAKSTCNEQCVNKDHKHPELVVSYHIPSIGVFTFRAKTKEEANKNLYEKLMSIYLNDTKKLIELEKLIKQISQTVDGA